MQRIELCVLTFLINSVWQTSLMVLMAVCCARILRKVEARHSHIMWVLALVLGLILPIMSTGRVRAPVWSVGASTDPVEVEKLRLQRRDVGQLETAGIGTRAGIT